MFVGIQYGAYNFRNLGNYAIRSQDFHNLEIHTSYQHRDLGKRPKSHPILGGRFRFNSRTNSESLEDSEDTDDSSSSFK